MRLQAAAVLAASVLAAACNPTSPSPSPTPERLAGDQTLSFPIAQDVADFDPALVSSLPDVDILRNVFAGLYRTDDRMQPVPDIAAGPATVSADGKAYTFQLRQDARFSNGDPITAADVVYSWNRAAARQGDYAWAFSLIAGYPAVASGAAMQLSGLSQVDPTTVQVTLTRPAGYFLDEVAMWPYWVVDRQVVESAGEDAWAASPATLIGAGPFRMTAHSSGLSLDFAPVTGWWGGETGALTRVHVDVFGDTAVQAQRYEAGVYSLLGYARQAVAVDKLKQRAQLVPLGVTYWAGFNVRAGPFAGVAGKAGRHAFSAAIDRAALAAAVCPQSACAPATGGVVSNGLQGFLGEGADDGAKFDAGAAKTEYATWDPTGAKVRGLAYSYDSSPFNKAVCANLQQQWKQNLGVTVGCVEVDRKTFLDRRNGACGYALFRQSWAADYDHPQDWFDNLFVTRAPSSGSCYSNASLDQLVASADRGQLSAGLVDYRTSGALLVKDSVAAVLLYGVQPYVVHPYVKGAGGNALYDYAWSEVRILAH